MPAWHIFWIAWLLLQQLLVACQAAGSLLALDLPGTGWRRCAGELQWARGAHGSWLPGANNTCVLVGRRGRSYAKAVQCLAHKKVAFLGDSHVRNPFRCFTDLLSAGDSARQLPVVTNLSHVYSLSLLEAERNQEKPDEAPPLWEVVYQDPGDTPPDPGNRHLLSCNNTLAQHNTDYVYRLRAPGGGAPTEVRCFWNPADVGKPYDFKVNGPRGPMPPQYAGLKEREVLLMVLKEAGFELAITGGNGRNHQWLQQYFPRRAIILNHRGNADGMAEANLAFGIPTADLTSVVGPLADPSRQAHLRGDLLRLQTRVVLTLAFHLLCPAEAAAVLVRRGGAAAAAAVGVTLPAAESGSGSGAGGAAPAGMSSDGADTGEGGSTLQPSDAVDAAAAGGAGVGADQQAGGPRRSTAATLPQRERLKPGAAARAAAHIVAGA